MLTIFVIPASMYISVSILGPEKLAERRTFTMSRPFMLKSIMALTVIKNGLTMKIMVKR